jgi:4-hydroxymandelate oxidase
VDFGTLRSLSILAGSAPEDARLDRLPLTWSDLEWIRERTTLPLVIKGILDPKDARRCVDLGVDGIIVSNHGGRQLDSATPSLFALRHISDEIGQDCLLLIDGGIRSGVDVVKALAFGAKAICLGRPYLWGLAIAGAPGVESVLRLLRLELEDALLQIGASRLCDVDYTYVATPR